MTPADLDLARGAIRAVRESATGRGILGPAALQCAAWLERVLGQLPLMEAGVFLWHEDGYWTQAADDFRGDPDAVVMYARDSDVVRGQSGVCEAVALKWASAMEAVGKEGDK